MIIIFMKHFCVASVRVGFARPCSCCLFARLRARAAWMSVTRSQRSKAPPKATTPTSSMSPTHWPASSTLASAVAWLLLSAVFAAAYVQGTEFAATKDSASVWGGVIGLSAFFAWLAVDYDEEEVAEGSSGSDEGSDEEDKSVISRSRAVARGTRRTKSE